MLFPKVFKVFCGDNYFGIFYRLGILCHPTIDVGSLEIVPCTYTHNLFNVIYES